jgi:hypothetical protein
VVVVDQVEEMKVDVKVLLDLVELVAAVQELMVMELVGVLVVTDQAAVAAVE